MDGSHHDWFEGRRDWAVLMVMVDDATNRTYARLFEAETTRAALEVFWAYVELYGVPLGLYVDGDIYEQASVKSENGILRDVPNIYSAFRPWRRHAIDFGPAPVSIAVWTSPCPRAGSGLFIPLS